MAVVMFITTYNPGVIGPRYIASSLKQRGHEPWLVHFKEFRPYTLHTEEWDKHEELAKSDVQFVYFQRPGYRLYAPYPTTITQKEEELLIQVIKEKKPEVIGFSLFTVTLEVVKHLTALIKKNFPDIPVAWGGVHCIMKPEECIQFADIVCAGEGEEIFSDFVDRISEYKAGKIPDIPGLWFNKNGAITKSDQHPVVDVDKVPYPMLMENEIVIDDDQISYKMNEPNYFIHNQVYVFTERGCPYKCSYCIHSVMKIPGFKKFRRRSVENVVGEIEERVNKYGFRHIIFHDEILGIDKKWVMTLMKIFKERFASQGITFTGYVHPLTTDAEMLQAMVDAGMTRGGIGLQSGSEYVNKEVFDRYWKPEKVIEMTRLLSQYTFEEIQIDMLTHNPFEKEEHRRETLEFLLQLYPPYHLEPFSLVVYELTTLAKKDIPNYGVDLKENLFWNMLYIMTGFKDRDPEFIRALSRDEYLKKNPIILEKIAAELFKFDKMGWDNRWEIHNLKKSIAQSAGHHIPPTILQRAMNKLRKIKNSIK